MYKLVVSTDADGRFDDQALDFQVVGDITSITPLTGSTAGGTLITIKGRNFSKDPLDNPVKIGDVKCLVVSTNKTTIKCRTEPTK